MAEPDVTGGQAVAEPTGTTASATTGQTEGQPVTTDQTTGNGADQGGESFFDYDLVKGTPNEPAYKQMQAAHGKKSEQLNAGLDKIKQYDQFMLDPMASIRQLAQQNGYQLVQGQPQDIDGKPISYSNWEEADAAADERAERKIEERMRPVLNEMQNMKKQNVEQMLDNSYSDWRVYEDAMSANLAKYPALVDDVDMLYRMSVPQEVLAARATKAALVKIQGTTGSTIQGQSATTQQITKKPVFKSINEAAKWAAEQPEVKALRQG